jgi:hypothetical protein
VCDISFILSLHLALFSWLLAFEWMKYLRIERHLAAKFGTGFAAFSVYVFFAMGG